MGRAFLSASMNRTRRRAEPGELAHDERTLDLAGRVIAQAFAQGDRTRRRPRRQSTARALIVEAPHPVFDTDTDEEALRIFTDLPARALVISGTHRCASSAASPCDGQTSACTGSSQSYPVSDMAHVTSSAFQAAHQALAAALPSAWVLNVHGMGGSGVSGLDARATRPAYGHLRRCVAGRMT